MRICLKTKNSIQQMLFCHDVLYPNIIPIYCTHSLQMVMYCWFRYSKVSVVLLYFVVYFLAEHSVWLLHYREKAWLNGFYPRGWNFHLGTLQTICGMCVLWQMFWKEDTPLLSIFYSYRSKMCSKMHFLSMFSNLDYAVNNIYFKK